MSSSRRPRSQIVFTRAGFTERQLAFIREYLVDLKPAEAARRAGYSDVSADRIAYALLHEHPAVSARVEEAKARRTEKKRVTADRVLEELGHMAFSNIRDYVDWGPEGMTLRSKTLLDEDETAAIADITPNGNGKVGRLKLYDKLAALNALARHLGMIGGKTALGAAADNDDRKDANAILRERLLRIARQGRG